MGVLRFLVVFLASQLLFGLFGATTSLADSHSVITRAVGARLCGYVSKQWTLGSIVSGSFVTHSEYIRMLENPSKAMRREMKKKTRTEKIAHLKSEVGRYNSQCVALSKPRISLTRLPKLDRIVSGAHSPAQAELASTGEAPTFSELSSRGVENVFWRPGIVSAILSGKPSTAQCREFTGSGPDGTSAGDNGCLMTQRTALAFKSVVDEAKDLCILQNVFTEEALASEGAKLISGALPSDTRKLLEPGATKQLIKASLKNTGIGNRDVYMQIASLSQNAAADKLYHVKLWQCVQGIPRRAEVITVSQTGDFVADLRVADPFERQSQFLTGKLHLQSNGGFMFDRSRARYARTIAGASTFFSISDVTVDEQNLLHVRSYSGFSNGSSTERSTTLSRISGERISGMRFLEGAHRSQLSGSGVPRVERELGVDYRAPYYVTDRTSPLRSLLRSEKFSNSFYNTKPTLAVDLSGYSCTVEPDLTIEFDLSNSTLRSKVAQCNGGDLSNFNYCGTQRIMAARMYAANRCR